MRRTRTLAATAIAAAVALLLAACADDGAASAPPDEFASAQDLVDTIGVGWNLGNALDSKVRRVSPGMTPAEQETTWSNVVTTQDLILAVHEAGFNTIRIPVTWHSMMDEQHTVREDWFERVEEVVGWAYDAGMIVILNTHHDEPLFSLFDDGMDDSVLAIRTLWEQIADRFAGYGQRLVFEGLNEPRTLHSELEWSGGTPEERRNVNVLNQVFVDAVRADGQGHNPDRLLMVPTYAAAVREDTIADFVLPTDPAGDDRLIVSLHMYAPYEFALQGGRAALDEWSEDGEGASGPDAIVWGLDLAYEAFVSQGVPVIMGEMGAQNRGNPQARQDWARFYLTAARERGIASIWWDNGGVGVTTWTNRDEFALVNRRDYSITEPDLIEAMLSTLP